MMIDFHTHTFPEKIAARALNSMSVSGNIKYCGEGTNDGLMASMKENNIDYSVILPVCTSPSQHSTINDTAARTNETSHETGLISFGGIHPDNENYRTILRDLSNRGFKGIKLHPCYQNVFFDDLRYKRIIECACENELIVVTHAGYDISNLDTNFASPVQILNVIEEIHPDRLVLAHMGGWCCYDDVLSVLAGTDVYFDTAIALTPVEPVDITKKRTFPGPLLDFEKFRNLVMTHGYDKILLGSDYPWSSQGLSAKLIKDSLFPENNVMSDADQAHETQVLDAIYSENAQKLLRI